jgi:hypothetical protein
VSPVMYACMHVMNIMERPIVEKMVALGLARNEYLEHALLFLFAYAFVVQFPSEAIPAVAAGQGGRSQRGIEGGYLVLTLGHRKNKPNRSRLVRGRWCKESASACPHPRIGTARSQSRQGSTALPDHYCSNCGGYVENAWVPGCLGSRMLWLKMLGFQDADFYRRHDLRRGHAKDLQLGGKIQFVGMVVAT